MDDLSSLQQVTEDITKEEAYLFKPKQMIRFQPRTGIMQFFPEPHFGQDPPYGGAIDYWLAEANDKVELEIVDADGNTVKTIKTKGKKGINRVMWDFRGESSDKMELHMKPLYADWYPMNDDGTRNSIVGKVTVQSPPGMYTVKMDIDGNSMEQSFELVKDPNSEGSLEDILAQVNMKRLQCMGQ